MHNRGRSVGVELALLVLIVATPLAALIAYLLYEEARRDEAAAAGLVMQMAVTTADRAERFVDTTRAALESIVKRPQVQRMDPERCDPGLADLREAYGRLANIVVIDPTGRIICAATPVPKGVVVRTGDEELLRDMLKEPRFRLSKPFVGRLSKRWTIAAALPVMDGGKVAGMVAMGVDLNDWVSFSTIPGEPRGTVHDVVTADGTIIARSAEAGAWIGKSGAASEVHSKMLAMRQGTVRARGTEGADRLWGFTPVPGAGDWFARTSVSANRVYGPVRERTLETGLLLAGVLAIAVVAALAAMARLVLPIVSIGQAVAERARGRSDVRVPVKGPREVAEMAAELNRMIDASELHGESLRRFRAAMDISGDAILLVDRATLQYVDVNRTLCRMLGYSREELVGMTPMDVFSADRATLERDYDMLIADPQSSASVVQGVYRRRDGSTFAVESRRQALRTDAGWIIVGTATDITARRQAEATLRESEERFRRTFELAGSGVAHIGLDRRFLRVNRRLCEILGYPEDELLQLTGKQISHPDDLDVIDKDRPALHAGGIDAIRVEKRYLRKDRSVVWVALTLTMQRDAAGQAQYEIAVYDDIDQRKQAEKSLQAAHDELARSNAELEQFAYVASHDLQEPLRMVSSYTQLLGKRYSDRFDGDAREFMAFIVDGASRMKQLIEDLLAYSRVGTRGKDFKPASLNTVFDRAKINLRGALEESGGELTRDPLPEVVADESQLVQLLQNLVGNALKFRREGVPPRVKVFSIEKQHEFEIVVQDNGIGIEPQYFERIFMVFQRLHDKGLYPGTGIGLAICKKVVDRHGGQLRVESVPGEGSRFIFTLPKHRNT